MVGELARRQKVIHGWPDEKVMRAIPAEQWRTRPPSRWGGKLENRRLELLLEADLELADMDWGKLLNKNYCGPFNNMPFTADVQKLADKNFGVPMIFTTSGIPLSKLTALDLGDDVQAETIRASRFALRAEETRLERVKEALLERLMDPQSGQEAQPDVTMLDGTNATHNADGEAPGGPAEEEG